MPTILDEDFAKYGVETLSSRPFRNVSRQTNRQMSICGTPEKSSYRQLSVSDRSSIRVEEIIPAARVAIQVRSARVMINSPAKGQGSSMSYTEFCWVDSSAVFTQLQRISTCAIKVGGDFGGNLEASRYLSLQIFELIKKVFFYCRQWKQMISLPQLHVSCGFRGLLLQGDLT